MLMTSLVMLIVIGALLTAWGWNRWRDFFAHPARCAIIAVFLIRFAHSATRLHPNMISKGIDKKRVRERGFFSLLYLGGLVVLASPYFDANRLWLLPGGDVIRYLGLALFVFGLGLAHAAQAHLGRFFSGHVTLQTDHRLITNGPFTVIRHPRYAGLMMFFLGLALVFRSAVGVGAGVFCALLFLGRIRREDALLAREFGDEWAAYSQRTKRLLPGIY